MDESIEDSASPINHYSNNLSDIPDDEEIIIKHLVQRYEQGQIYTWVGPLLLAINSSAVTAHLDDPLRLEKFADNRKVSHGDIEPHVFAIAARAQYRLTHVLAKVHQVIIISGDSGSGKTFTACEALTYLAFMNENSPGNTLTSTLRKISSARSLISAFSTATTEINKSSSRHGQLLQLQYRGRSIDGAVINSFLLERSRVTSEKNNFHIFYQVLAGLPDSKLHALKLSRTSKYNIISDACSRTDEHHLKGYHETLAAMQALDFGDETRHNILKVIALLIHLGNVKFKKSRTEICLVDVDEEGSRNSLQGACELASLPVNDLTELLTTTLISPQSQWRRHTVYHRSLDSIETCYNRLRCIIRYLYDRLFHWLVDSLNETLAAKGKNYSLLGILDIFGFESFTVNGIEQLCINYASERLQLYFNQEYLETRRKELEEEGLGILPLQQATHIYQQRITVIEASLFAVLNDACFLPGVQGNSSLKHQLLAVQEKTKTFLRIEENSFVIRHYSCPVNYSTYNMLPKNTDKVPGELPSTFSRCGNTFILSLIGSAESETCLISRVYAKKNTTLAKLKLSLDALMKELDKCDSHYIRCVKPINKGCRAREEFREQLACSGVFDALPLVRCGFPIRLRYGEFHKRYSIDPTETCDTVQRCKAILKKLLSSEELKSSVHFGRRLIFLTEALLNKLELFRDEHYSKCATKIQRFWIKHKSRKAPKQSEKHSKRNDIEQKQAIPLIPPSLSQHDNDVFSIEITGHSTTSVSEMNDGNTKQGNQSYIVQQQKSSNIHTVFGNDYSDRKHTNIMYGVTRKKQTTRAQEGNSFKIDASNSRTSSGNIKQFVTHVNDMLETISESSLNKTCLMERETLDSRSNIISYKDIGITSDLHLNLDDDTRCYRQTGNQRKLMEETEWRNRDFRSKTKNADEIETCIDVSGDTALVGLNGENPNQSNVLQTFEEDSANNDVSNNNILSLDYTNSQQLGFAPVSQQGEPILEQEMDSDVSSVNIQKSPLEHAESFDEIPNDNVLINDSSAACAFPKSSTDSQHFVLPHITLPITSSTMIRYDSNCFEETKLPHSNYIKQYSYNVYPHDEVDDANCLPIVRKETYDNENAAIHHNKNATFKRCDRVDEMPDCPDEFNNMHWEGSVSRLREPAKKSWTRLLSHSRLPFSIENDSDPSDGNSHTVCLENRIFYYKHGILSKRRLCEVPVRFHTKLTCLPGSHQLPRSELPRGLQDCL